VSGYVVLGFGMVIVTAVMVAASLGLRGAVDFFLATYLVAATEVIGVAILLSPFGALNRAGLLLASAGLLTAAGAVWVWRGRPPPPVPGGAGIGRDILRDPAVALLAAAVSVALLYAAVLAVATPPNDWDALWYHLARPRSGSRREPWPTSRRPTTSGSTSSHQVPRSHRRGP
jgi:hypothetical protein